MPTETKHTPGPWYTKAKPDSLQGLVISEVTGASIAVTYDPRDAHLVSAAPELLRTLEQILDCNKRLGAISRPVADEARAAITKAKGGQ